MSTWRGSGSYSKLFVPTRGRRTHRNMRLRHWSPCTSPIAVVVPNVTTRFSKRSRPASSWTVFLLMRSSSDEIVPMTEHHQTCFWVTIMKTGFKTQAPASLVPYIALLRYVYHEVTNPVPIWRSDDQQPLGWKVRLTNVKNARTVSSVAPFGPDITCDITRCEASKSGVTANGVTELLSRSSVVVLFVSWAIGRARIRRFT